ncbi:MAG: hypothetical protein SGPRY_007393 [Prymnesium sp.]
MGVRDLQALAAEAKALSYDATYTTAAIEPALAKRIQTVRATVVNNTDTNSHAAKTVSVMDDLEKALQERTAEFERIRRNYAGLHSICEEYNEQLSALRDARASGGEPEELRRLKVENHRIPVLERRLLECSKMLEEKEAQLATACADLASSSAALQEASSEKKKIQQLMRAGQQAAIHGGEELKATQESLATLKQEIGQYKQAALSAEATRMRSEQSMQDERRARESLEAELEKMRRLVVEEAQAAAIARSQLGAMKELREELAALKHRLSEEQSAAEAALTEQKQLLDQSRAACIKAEAGAQKTSESLRAELELRKSVDDKLSATVKELEKERDATAALRIELDESLRSENEARARATQLEMERDLLKEELEIQKELFRQRLVPDPEPEPPSPPPAPASKMPSVDEMQFHALRSELEGWQIVNEEMKTQKERAEMELATALRTIGHLKDQLGSRRSSAIDVDPTDDVNVRRRSLRSKEHLSRRSSAIAVEPTEDVNSGRPRSPERSLRTPSHADRPSVNPASQRASESIPSASDLEASSEHGSSMPELPPLKEPSGYPSLVQLENTRSSSVSGSGRGRSFLYGSCRSRKSSCQIDEEPLDELC